MFLDAFAAVLEGELSLGFASPSATKHGARAQPDLISEDGTIVISVKTRLPGVRELHASVMQLAMAAAEPSSKHAVLALWEPRVSEKSLRRDWETLREVFARKVRDKLELVALWADDRALVSGGLAARVARPLRIAIKKDEIPHRRVEKRQEVLKILLLRWLRHEPPVSVKELQVLTGASFPTTSKALRELERYLVRTDRKIELRSFPREAWIVLTALAPRLRDTAYFMDASGRDPDVERLVQRLGRVEETALGLGGVLAARHWDKEFDLDGTPRVDVTVHAPGGRADLSFLRQVNPALHRTNDPAKTVLAVHSLTRPESFFSTSRPRFPRWADPVETLLDLTELRLAKQADELVRHLRENWLGA